MWCLEASCPITPIFLAVKLSMLSCRMVSVPYELELVSRPEKDVLYPPFNLVAFGNPRGQGSILLPSRKCDSIAC